MTVDYTVEAENNRKTNIWSITSGEKESDVVKRFIDRETRATSCIYVEKMKIEVKKDDL